MPEKNDGEIVGNNIKRFRLAQRPKLTRRELASKVNVDGVRPDYKTIESVERGLSLKIAKQLVPQLAKLWKKSEMDFWTPDDGTLVSANDALSYGVEEDVDIRLHEPTSTGKVTIINSSRITTVPSGLARFNPIAIVVPDIATAPRFPKGRILFSIPRQGYDHGCWVLVQHRREIVTTEDGQEGPAVYIRWYDYEGGKNLFSAPNSAFPAFTDEDVEILGLCVRCRTNYANGWYCDEVCLTGLPKANPT